MSEKFDAIDELGKAAHMPPKSTQDVLIVDPGRIAELEAEVERLREDLEKAETWIGRLEDHSRDDGELLDQCRSYLCTLPDDEEQASLLINIDLAIGQEND